MDTYAQNLRRLFYRAHPRSQQGSRETEEFGRSILAYQFVAGLLPEIRRRLAGQEGTFDQFLVRARFEEAKLKELGSPDQNPTPKKTQPQQRSSGGGEQGSTTTPPPRNQPSKTGSVWCYHCRGSGHIAKHCPMKGRTAPEESRGGGGGGGKGPAHNMATLVVSDDPPSAGETRDQLGEKVERLQKELQEAEMEKALADTMATMWVLTTEGDQGDAVLGPTLSATVLLEGVPVSALLDTCSPVTNVSMDFLLQALKEQRVAGQSPAEWAQTVRERLQPPSLSLQNYGGDRLSIIR